MQGMVALQSAVLERVVLFYRLTAAVDFNVLALYSQPLLNCLCCNTYTGVTAKEKAAPCALSQHSSTQVNTIRLCLCCCR